MKKLGKKLTSGIILTSMFLSSAAPVFAYTKDETIYSKLDGNGNTYQTIVSNHLKNTEKSELLKDITDLINIENVGGNQELEEKEGKMVWKANGEDIYYQGNTQKELPIECKITYFLDGKEISKEEIAGKSGLVKVKLEFTNKEKREVTINGKLENMYVPFVVAVGTVFNNENNKNIKITNGKLIDNGNTTMAFGIALPGMQESLGISKDTIEIPTSVEISMEVKDFEMNEIYCFATPKLIDESDLDIFNKIDKIYGLANELKDGSNQLVQGAKKISDGANAINEGTNQLSKELNTTLGKYENAKNKITNKKEIEEKIVNILNDELKNLMPELQNLAVEEAKNVVRNNLKGENGLEAKTAETALYYSKLAINEKLNELKNVEVKIPEELLSKIQNDIQIALKNIQDKPDVQALENQIKQIIIKDITGAVKEKTNEVITNNVETMKSNISDPTALLTENEKNALNKSKKEIAKAMVPGIKAQAEANGMSITDEQAMEKALNSVNSLVTSVSKKTMDKTLTQVEKQAPTMAENAVKDIATNFSTNEELKTAIIKYSNKIVSEVKTTVGDETFNAIKNNIKNYILEELTNLLKNNYAFQNQITNKIKQEVNSTIEGVADKTAQKLAEDFTEDLANQIASNLIKKQLNGELANTELDKELEKYENLINSKLGEVDGKINTLKNALNQLTDGTAKLADGAEELSNGMSTFDQKGIQKIYNIVNNNVKDLQVRLEKLKELSNEYNTYTKIDEKAEGNVKYIIMIDNLKKKEENQQPMLPAEDKKDE